MQLHERITRNLALTVTGIGLAITASSANAQTWETLLDLQDTNNADINVLTLLVDPYSGQLAPSRLFVGGHIGQQAVVFVFDQATGTYDRHDVPNGFQVNQLGVDPSSGNLFSAMYSGWLSKSADSGTNWTVADTFVGDASSFAADDAGNLYVAGRATDSAGQDHWVVRKSTDHGQTWATVDNYPNASPGKIHSIPGTNGGLFVVGYRITGSGANTTYAWIIRRSREAEPPGSRSITTPGVETWALERSPVTLKEPSMSLALVHLKL
jgi:hypothetical protein